MQYINIYIVDINQKGTLKQKLFMWYATETQTLKHDTIIKWLNKHDGTVVPPNTAPPLTASPNTAAHFQVPNKVFLGYIILISLPVSEYRRFFVSPEVGGIGRGDCNLKAQRV